PISRRTMVTPITSQCIAITEALAEKFRAALSRREVAIRDFFDIDYAVRILGVQPEDAEFVALVRAKLAVPGNGPLNASTARLAALRRQLGPELRPVLRERDFREFDLERAFGIVAGMASRLSEAG
ncbi:MAG: nucleotidyl transferase AbiEii/AbiGii toxin family protein, partial [Candidatus Methylomirabilota bacterium]